MYTHLYYKAISRFASLNINAYQRIITSFVVTISIVYIYIFIPHRLGNGRGLEMIYPCCIGVIYPCFVGVIYPCFVGMIYPCSVGLVDLLCIFVCQNIHVVKAVGSKFVTY